MTQSNPKHSVIGIFERRWCQGSVWNFNGNEFTLAPGTDALASASVGQTTKSR